MSGLKPIPHFWPILKNKHPVIINPEKYSILKYSLTFICDSSL